jgi:ComF family protein
MNWKERPKHLGMEVIIPALIDCLLEYEFDAIVYVPYHWKRLLKRGRNPVRELSSCLANHLKLPLLDIIKRPVQKHTQKGLNRKQRQRNLREAFALRSDLRQISKMNLLLIDDVVTTGATCNEIARLLKNKGATSVTVACLARTPLKA